MGLGFLTENFSISLRKFITIMFLFSSSFAWFLSFYNRFDDIFSFFIPTQFWLNIGTLFFLISIIASGLTGSFLINKIDRKNLILWSTILGVLSSGALLFFNGAFFAFFPTSLPNTEISVDKNAAKSEYHRRVVEKPIVNFSSSFILLFSSSPP